MNEDFLKKNNEPKLNYEFLTKETKDSEGRIVEEAHYTDSEPNVEVSDQLSSISTERHNVVGDISLLRDTFLSAEREYVLELLKKDYIIEMIRQFNQLNPELLYKAAFKITEDVDNGLVPDAEMEKTEQKLTVLLAAIQDKSLLKMLGPITSGNYHTNTEEEHISHSR